MSSRHLAAGSLAVIGLYAIAVSVAAWTHGVPFAAVEAFPLGAAVGQGGKGLAGTALSLGLLLGWAVPGLALARCGRADLEGAALLARATILGVAYLVVTGAAHALVRGHGPTRLVLLCLLALPPAVLWWRSRGTRDRRLVRTRVAIAALVGLFGLTAVLWAKLRYEGMNGDGTEAYELSRSLDAHALPHWEIEREHDQGAFGIPLAVPYFAGAHLVFAEMTILGRGELATRLVFVPAVLLLGVLAAGLSRCGDRSARAYTVAVSAVFVLWSAYFVSYSPPADLAEPAGTDALTVLMWLAAAWELLAGALPLAILGFALACGMTYGGPLLGALLLGALWVVDRERGARALRVAVPAALAGAALLAVIGWASGDGPAWVGQVYEEYWLDLVAADRRVPVWPLAWRAILMTGGLPVLAFFVWPRLSLSGRVLCLTGAAYLAVVFAGSDKPPHYLAPVPWIFLAPALQASTAAWRWGATAALVCVFLLSWPAEPAARRDTIELGREACVRDFDYEAAALQSHVLYDALAPPLETDRYAIGRHTFVRYALELGGADCVIGLSARAPEGSDVLVLVDGPATIWTADLDRFVAWRFRAVAWPASRLFPQPSRLTYPPHAADWVGRLDLSEEPARSLLIAGRDPEKAGGLERVRVLVPVQAVPTEVRLGVRRGQAGVVRWRVNGREWAVAQAGGGESVLTVPASWRQGWNLLELDSEAPVSPLWLEARPR